MRGFTLIELVMVIVLLGVMAIFVAPKFAETSVFNVRGFHDETLAYLRYAQSAAVAQRRTVCVAFSSNSIGLSMASAGQSYNCDAALTGPRGDRPALANAKSGVVYDGALPPETILFDALGQPVDATGTSLAKQSIQVKTAAQTITVEAVTGYVHD
jgi:MSHA pilin protein MshC